MTEILFADAADFERWLTQIGAENRRIVVPCIEFVLHNFETLPANRVWTKRVGGDIQQIRIGPTLNHVLRLVDAEKTSSNNNQPLLLRVFFVRTSTNQFVILSAYDKLNDLSRDRQRCEIEKATGIYERWTNRNEVF